MRGMRKVGISSTINAIPLSRRWVARERLGGRILPEIHEMENAVNTGRRRDLLAASRANPCSLRAILLFGPVRVSNKRSKPTHSRPKQIDCANCNSELLSRDQDADSPARCRQGTAALRHSAVYEKRAPRLEGARRKVLEF
jgi:hypothetical protein